MLSKKTCSIQTAVSAANLDNPKGVMVRERSMSQNITCFMIPFTGYSGKDKTRGMNRSGIGKGCGVAEHTVIWGAGTALYPDRGDGYKTLYMC